MDNVPIPQRKPTFESSNGGASGFLESLLSTIESVSNSAFKVSGNVVAVKNLFDGETNPNFNGEGAEAQYATNNMSSLNQKSGLDNSTLIGLGMAFVGLILLMDD